MGVVQSEGIILDTAFAGGNGMIDRIGSEVIELHPDLRDTEGDWFYWCFRVRGAEGRTLTFRFTKQEPIGARGPAVSLDGGWTWQWLGRTSTDNSVFTYTFPQGANEMWFGMGMTYTQRHLDAFLGRLAEKVVVQREVLCQSRKGRAVERLHMGRLDGEPRFRILLTARHHACEMMASYALEGLLEAAATQDELGRWFRDQVDLLAVPFVDKDGVEDGDQGKNRIPRDHNRDYSGPSIHPETGAIRDFVPVWLKGVPAVVLDLHCPWIRGDHNEVVYQVGQPDPRIWSQQERFGDILQRVQRGTIVYRRADDLPFGQGWNSVEGMGTKGTNSTGWASQLPGILLANVIELPYANAGGSEVNQTTARAFGRDLAAALKDFLE